jgi:hypothetical protein
MSTSSTAAAGTQQGNLDARYHDQGRDRRRVLLVDDLAGSATSKR